MSEHHRWYVTGRTLRLAFAYVLFASLFVVNPAFAAEVTALAAQKTAISDSPVTAPLSADAEQLSVAYSVADKAATAGDFLTPAAENKAGGVVVLSETGKTTYETALELARKVATKLGSTTAAGEQKPGDAATFNALLPAAGNKAGDVLVFPKTGIASPAVLELQRYGKPVAANVIVWERDFEYFLPVARLAQILKFPSRFDPAALKVEGTFLNPDNLYSIDLSAGTYTVQGKTLPLPVDAVLKPDNTDRNEDIYLKAEVLNAIWPLQFKINVLNQSISIETRKKLPFELERERKRQQEKLERGKKEKEELERLEQNYVYTPNGYKLLGPQTLFLSQNLRWDSQKKNPRNNVFVSGQGDLLGTSADYSLNLSHAGINTALDDFFIHLRREDYESGKLLPYGLDLVDLGDISVRTPALVSGSLQGTGIFVSSDRDHRQVDFDEVTIEGNASPGWDVEIYRGGVLIDFGEVDKLGHYRFENVPLTFGNNIMRLVFYGPNGETEERIENYSIGRSFLKPGETTYQVGVVKPNTRIIDLRDTESKAQPGTATTFRINRGINRYLSGYATFTNLDVIERTQRTFFNPIITKEKQKYLTIGANFNALGGYGQVEAYKQLDGGTALDLRFARNFMGFDTSVRQSVFRDFESQKTGTGDSRRETQTTLSVAKGLPPPFAFMHFNFTLDHSTYADAPADTIFTTGQSATSALGNFSSTSSTSFTGGDIRSSSGQISFNRNFLQNLGFNSKLSYNMYPETELNALDLNLSYTDADRFRASAGYGQSLIDTGARSVNFGAAYDFDAFTGNANLNWNTDSGVEFTVGTSTTLGPQGEDNVYNFRRAIDGQPTRLSVRLYEDLNHDGTFGPEDHPVPGARVVLNGGVKSKPTNEEGYVEIAPAGNEGLTTITLDRPSLSYNPFLISAEKDGHSTILRAGTEPHINFPLVMSGTIDGSVRDQNGHGMPDITVQLINAHGKLVGESTSLSDGFFVFELVRPGRYVVQIHPSHHVFVPPKTVMVATDDLFLYGTDLQVLSNQTLGQASAAAVAHDVEETGRVAHTYQPRAAVGTEMPVNPIPSGGGVQPAASEDSSAADGVQPVIGNTTSERGVQPAVRAVRIGEYPGKVRLVLDLSGPAVYRISKEDNGSAITIDLPDTKWEAAYNFAPDKQNLLQNIETTQLPAGGTRIKVTGTGTIDVSHDLFLPATSGKGDRIFIDFMRAR